MISSIRKAFDLIITSSLNTTVGAARHNATGLNVLRLFQIFFHRSLWYTPQFSIETTHSSKISFANKLCLLSNDNARAFIQLL
jgi:hypothetical protein